MSQINAKIQKIELEARAHRPADMPMHDFMNLLESLGNKVIRVEGDDVVIAFTTKTF